MIPFATRPKRPRESPYKAHPRLGPYPSYPPFASLREGAHTARLLAPGSRLRERTRRLRIFLNCPLPPARPRSEHLVVAEGKVVDAGQTPQTVTYVPGLFRYRCRRLHNSFSSTFFLELSHQLCPDTVAQGTTPQPGARHPPLCTRRPESPRADRVSSRKSIACPTSRRRRRRDSPE